MSAVTFIFIGLIIFIGYALVKTAVVVPQKHAYVVERLGKYQKTLESGFHILIPFIDKIAYRLILKEMALDVPPQVCITRDNVCVEVDGLLYLQVLDPVKASYGISQYEWASIQLAQTTMRSEIGKLELDKTFEEREHINSSIVQAVDKASSPWGVKVARYEIKNITPPQSIREAMEKQMRAEREKRAQIAESEGQTQSKINLAEADKREAIARSEGEKQRRINEAEGRASEIERVAFATAKGIREIASAIGEAHGSEAVNLRIAEQYLQEFGKLAKQNNTMIIPSNLSDISSVIASISQVLKFENASPGTGPASPKK